MYICVRIHVHVTERAQHLFNVLFNLCRFALQMIASLSNIAHFKALFFTKKNLRLSSCKANYVNDDVAN